VYGLGRKNESGQKLIDFCKRKKVGKSLVSYNNSCHERHWIQEDTGCKKTMDNRGHA